MKLFFGGSAAFTVATLLAASLLFFTKPLFAETSTQQQQPTSIEQTPKEKNETAPIETEQASETTGASVPAAPAVSGTETPAATAPTTAPAAKSDKTTIPAGSTLPEAVTDTPIDAEPITEPQAYVATAYNLPGRTASGMRVAKGIIAADPRVLPLGTRVRLDAGPYSGEYIVADTGSAVKGRKIDVWVPSYREACRFGRRHVKLSVLSYGKRRGAATHARRRSR
jgi:3D (Asp-Asp-Asp) domain-containing protein